MGMKIRAKGTLSVLHSNTLILLVPYSLEGKGTQDDF